jgi:hypothetical protein
VRETSARNGMIGGKVNEGGIYGIWGQTQRCFWSGETHRIPTFLIFLSFDVLPLGAIMSKTTKNYLQTLCVNFRAKTLYGLYKGTEGVLYCFSKCKSERQ